MNTKIKIISLLMALSFKAVLFAAPYTDNSDGTVTDTRTNLRWQMCSNGLSGASCGTGTASTINWNNALTYCQGLSLAGKIWRLPSKNELLSIADRGKSNPAIDTTAFPATKNSAYWSSTTYPPGSAACSVDFTDGYSHHPSKTATNYVRCVATGP